MKWRPPSWERYTPSSAIQRLLACVLPPICGFLSISSFAAEPSADDIQLELSPRICTLSVTDKQCDAEVHATWRAAHDESLCLVIQERPDVKHCWENYSQGTYSLELTFTQDVVFELRDLELQHVMASEVLRVIREALHYRHRRRQPWNIFD